MGTLVRAYVSTQPPIQLWRHTHAFCTRACARTRAYARVCEKPLFRLSSIGNHPLAAQGLQLVLRRAIWAIWAHMGIYGLYGLIWAIWAYKGYMAYMAHMARMGHIGHMSHISPI